MNHSVSSSQKTRWSYLVLAIYNILLVAGALWSGLPMFTSNSGVYAALPPEWNGKLPFDSWAAIGCIAMFFALGNAVAAVLCVTKRRHALPSLLMGLLLAAGMALQIVLLNEMYLATGEFLLAAFIQIMFSAVLLIRHRFVATATEHAR